jgi:hypothetical protein
MYCLLVTYWNHVLENLEIFMKSSIKLWLLENLENNLILATLIFLIYLFDYI